MHHSGGRERGRNKPHSEGGGRMQKVTSRAGVERGKREEIVFLQLSDIHLDRQYSEVRVSVCGCCVDMNHNSLGCEQAYITQAQT